MKNLNYGLIDWNKRFYNKYNINNNNRFIEVFEGFHESRLISKIEHYENFYKEEKLKNGEFNTILECFDYIFIPLVAKSKFKEISTIIDILYQYALALNNDISFIDKDFIVNKVSDSGYLNGAFEKSKTHYSKIAYSLIRGDYDEYIRFTTILCCCYILGSFLVDMTKILLKSDLHHALLKSLVVCLTINAENSLKTDNNWIFKSDIGYYKELKIEFFNKKKTELDDLYKTDSICAYFDNIISKVEGLEKRDDKIETPKLFLYAMNIVYNICCLFYKKTGKGSFENFIDIVDIFHHPSLRIQSLEWNEANIIKNTTLEYNYFFGMLYSDELKFHIVLPYVVFDDNIRKIIVYYNILNKNGTLDIGRDLQTSGFVYDFTPIELQDETPEVVLKIKFSKTIQIKQYGVVEVNGMILEPILFNAYVNTFKGVLVEILQKKLIEHVGREHKSEVQMRILNQIIKISLHSHTFRFDTSVYMTIKDVGIFDAVSKHIEKITKNLDISNEDYSRKSIDADLRKDLKLIFRKIFTQDGHKERSHKYYLKTKNGPIAVNSVFTMEELLYHALPFFTIFLYKQSTRNLTHNETLELILADISGIFSGLVANLIVSHIDDDVEMFSENKLLVKDCCVLTVKKCLFFFKFE